MNRIRLFLNLLVLTGIQCGLCTGLPLPSSAGEWMFGEKPRGVLKIADLGNSSVSAMLNYAEGLISLDKENNWVPCLAVNAKWIDDRTIEFKLRQGVRFHNGEKFNAEAVSVNWTAYRKMKSPRPHRFLVPSDETELEIRDEYTVRFTFPEPDGLALVRFRWFCQFAPSFFEQHEFEEGNWGYLPEPGPWGTGPFRLVEGSVQYGRPSARLVLEAFESYWDPAYPKVRQVIFDNTVAVDRDVATRLCMEEEGAVDLVNFIRPLDTLKVAESPYARVVKSRDITALGGTFNMRKRGSKWRDIRLRKAINYAINREELWKYAAKGNAYNLEGFLIPEGADGHNPDLDPYIYDTTRARSLIAEAGYPDGFAVQATAHESDKLEAQIMKRMLERVGIRVTLSVVNPQQWFRNYYIPLLDGRPEEQDWDLSIATWHNYHGKPAVTFLNFGFIEESDFRWIEYDPVYEQMWKDMVKTVDVDAQEARIHELVKYVHDQAYALFVYSPLSLYAVNKEVEFVPYGDSWLHFKETSVTDRHWSVRGEKQ